MGLLDIASANSFWRGYDYFKALKVKSCSGAGPNRFEGTVEGSGNNVYHVMIDLEHPKKSFCDCPHAEGSRRVCKHKVAMYFSVFPEAADKAYQEAEAWEEESEEEELTEEEEKEIVEYVNSLTVQQLKDELLWRLIEEREKMKCW